MKACGIDLGTTNSCIHIVTRDGPKLILDAHGNKTVPSVVYRSRDGRTSVGHAARNRIGEMNGPVATIKRKMGSDETVILGGESKTPVDVSAMILRHLKEMAEAAEGEPVDRAVVTVPAYFAHIQRQQTDDAARAAGFVEVTTLLEPVAAALAYSLESQHDHLRVFVYDLGGGTFDATVLEKDSEGGLNVLSFGGDPYLGGDNFDARLVRLMLARLTDKGYKLDLDLERAEDFSRYQRLKFFAESAKISLTESNSVLLVHQGLFKDQAGDLIDLELTITRAELEEATADLVERSIQESLRTIEKNNIDPASIDEIIMVGGMSRMPLVQQRLKETFTREPKLVDPDLIVSRGAALKAEQLFPERIRGKGNLRVELKYDRRTAARRTRVAAVMDQAQAGGTAYLFGHGEDRSVDLTGKDRFLFDGISLQEDYTHQYAISIEDAQGLVIFEEEIQIVQDCKAEPVLASPGSVVTKPISVLTLDGPQALFPENTSLPHFASVSLATADQGGVIRLPIVEGEYEVQRMTIQDIPRDLPVGTTVQMEISIRADYHIEARATIPAIRREVSIAFRIEPLSTASLTRDYIRGRLDELRQAAETQAAQCKRHKEVEIFNARFKGLLMDIEMELSEPESNRLKIRDKLVAAESLIQQISIQDDGIKMPGKDFDEFSEALTKVETDAIEMDSPKLPELRPKLDLLRRDAERAWKERDRTAWLRANKQLEYLQVFIIPDLPPDELAVMMGLGLLFGQLPEIHEVAGETPELAGIEREVQKILAGLQSESIPASVAVNQFRQLYKSRVEPLRKRYGLEPSDLESSMRTPQGSGFTKKS